MLTSVHPDRVVVPLDGVALIHFDDEVLYCNTCKLVGVVKVQSDKFDKAVISDNVAFSHREFVELYCNTWLLDGDDVKILLGNP